MASFARTLTTASLLPAVVAVAAFSHSSLFHSSRFRVKSDLPFSNSLLSASAPRSFEAVKNQFRPKAALHMESVAVDVKPSDEQTGVLPELMSSSSTWYIK